MKSIDKYKDIVFKYFYLEFELEHHNIDQETLVSIIKEFVPIAKDWNPTRDVKNELLDGEPSNETLSNRLDEVFYELEEPDPIDDRPFSEIFDESMYANLILEALYDRCNDVAKGKLSNDISDYDSIKMLIACPMSFSTMLWDICNRIHYKPKSILAQKLMSMPRGIDFAGLLDNAPKTQVDERKDTMRMITKAEHKEAGRPRQNDFDTLLVGSDDEKAKRLHAISICMQGAKGKKTALAMYCCFHELQWLSEYPQFKVIEKKFGDIGNETGFYNYRDGKRFSKDEIERMTDSLKSHI